MSRARDLANLGDINASDITTGTLGNTVQDNITRLGTVTTGTMNNTIGSSATFPAGTVLQVVQAQDDVNFQYTNSGQEWNFGTATTRGNDSHGGVADNLNCTITTKGVNSNFLVCANLQNTGASATGYNWGMSTYWSVDSYANPIVKGDPSGHLYSSGTGLQSGHWQAQTGDEGWYPHYTQVLKTGNTISKNTSITFKIVISSRYTSGGNIVYYNRQNTSSSGNYRLVPVSTHTIYEIAT